MLFVIAAFFFAAGYMDSFSLIDKHLADIALVQSDYLPLLYSYAMFIDAISALVFGFLFDRIGFLSVGFALAFGSLCLFLLRSYQQSDDGILRPCLTSWGIGMGAIESILQAGCIETFEEGRKSEKSVWLLLNSSMVFPLSVSRS